MTQTFHQSNSGIIHINPNTIPSGINRTQFKTWKENYWKDRALVIIKVKTIRHPYINRQIHTTGPVQKG